jgi:hypothetical protein
MTDTLELNGVPVTALAAQEYQLSILLWGKAACGKTVAAVTAPGKKLWILFDPKGTASLGPRDDVLVADFASYPIHKLQDFKEDGTMKNALKKVLLANPDVETIVVDSVTQFAENALAHAIVSRVGATAKFQPSFEAPGMQAYGARLAVTMSMIRMMLLIAGEHKKHIIFITHEGQPDKDDNGVTREITLMLGGGLPSAVPLKISEVWYMRDTGKDREIFVRPFQYYSPMRSRMFRTQQASSFKFRYDLETGQGEGIADWYKRWSDSGFTKIDLPK